MKLKHAYKVLRFVPGMSLEPGGRVTEKEGYVAIPEGWNNDITQRLEVVQSGLSKPAARSLRDSLNDAAGITRRLRIASASNEVT